LGVHITSAKPLKPLPVHQQMLRNPSTAPLNAVFGKVAGVASEEVTVELLKVKCLPVLLYGIEACPD